MTELLWQSTLLLAVAFFFGAVLSCGLKRRYYYGRSTKQAPVVAAHGVSHAPAPNEPKIEVAHRTAPEGERFNRAISGQSAPVAAPTTPPIAATAPKPAAAAPAAAPPISKISVSAGSGAPVKADAGGAGPSDDLTRIRGIDSGIQKQLKDRGVRRFQDLAGLTAADVKGLNEALGVKGRIEQENWLGQAQILATGGETYYSRRVDRGMPVPEFTEPASLAPAASAQPAPAPKPEPAAQPISKISVLTGSGAPLKPGEGGGGPSDDLTRVRGIDTIVQQQLKELGIRRFDELAGLTAADVKGLNETLGAKGRIEQENWLGQAQILATGGETYYSRRLDRGTPVPAAAEPTSAAPAASATAAAAASQPAASADMGALRSVRSEALLGAEATRSPRGWTEADDLKRIRGIGVLIEKKLNSLGVTHYEQVANWTGADIERISNILDFKGRIERENWIEQARILATGGQTEFSRRNEA